MSLVPVSCPYCGAENSLQIISRSITDKATIKAISHEETDNLQIPKYEIKCRLCFKEYELIKVTDYRFIRSKLKPLSTMIIAFNARFPNHTLDSIFNHVLGLTRPKKSIGDAVFRRNPHLHICFEIDGQNAYVDCEQIIERGKTGKTILRGLDIGG